MASPLAAQHANLPVRLACGLYEMLLVLGVLMLAGFVLVPFGTVLNHDEASRHLYTQAWMLLVVTIYFTWFWSHGGQTLPMKTWRLRLCMADGGTVSPQRALARFGLALAGVGIAGLHFAWALVDPEGLFLHDRLLGTRIVRISAPGQ